MSGKTPLHCVSLDGHLPVVQYLCEQVRDKEARDGNEMTPLHKRIAISTRLKNL